MPGRTPMKARINSGLRRWSLVRSAALRSGLATISAMRSRLIGPLVDWHAATIVTASNASAQRRRFPLAAPAVFHVFQRGAEQLQILLVLGSVGAVDLDPLRGRPCAQAAGLE